VLRDRKIIFTFEEIIFLKKRCIVRKKAYLCRAWPEKWPGYKESGSCFILVSKLPISNKKGRDNDNAHSVYMYIIG